MYELLDQHRALDGDLLKPYSNLKVSHELLGQFVISAQPGQNVEAGGEMAA